MPDIKPDTVEELQREARLAALKAGAVNDAVREILIEHRREIILRAVAKLKKFNVEVSPEDTLGI